MRLILFILCCGMFCAGCKHSQSGAPSRGASKAKSRASANAAKQNAQAAPVDESTGKVVAVNSNLRFVVIDYSLGKLPALERRLGVYRQGQKVGEVKISGPEQSNNIVADITTGDARLGDEVRAD
ncbi:MAG: hypothetical protein FJ403_21355 [Verrucomicrobia bacterium]|nr:hypothetical protein [Verrucomicrobiota bacterium]